jgi:hypothetical protein
MKDNRTQYRDDAGTGWPRKGPLDTRGGGSTTSLLELRHVSKVYGEGGAEVHALRDVYLSV